MPDTLVIYNPNAGRGKVQTYWRQVEKALLDAGLVFDSVPTKGYADALHIARQAPQKYSTIISVGGDGTAHEIVNGLMRASNGLETIALGLVPMGNGDDFAKIIPPETEIGQRPFNWEEAVRKIARGQTRLFDVGMMSGDNLRHELSPGPHYFINSMDVGFGAHAARNYITVPPQITGVFAYLAAILKTMVRYPKLHLRIHLDDQPPIDKTTTITAVMNGRCFANSFWVAPNSRADDGLFDIMVTDAVSRPTILRVIPKLMKGQHLDEPILRMYRAQKVVLESDQPLLVEADGELPFLETHRLEVTNLHKKLRIIV
jgi:diacylglycerol kinase (ATP)